MSYCRVIYKLSVVTLNENKSFRFEFWLFGHLTNFFPIFQIKMLSMNINEHIKRLDQYKYKELLNGDFKNIDNSYIFNHTLIRKAFDDFDRENGTALEFFYFLLNYKYERDRNNKI